MKEIKSIRKWCALLLTLIFIFSSPYYSACQELIMNTTASNLSPFIIPQNERNTNLKKQGPSFFKKPSKDSSKNRLLDTPFVPSQSLPTYHFTNYPSSLPTTNSTHPHRASIYPSSDNAFGKMMPYMLKSVGQDMPSSYWNYNPSSQYGPKTWDNVYVKDSEYMKWISDDDNDCGDDDQQSPVKIRHETRCRDDHQIHNRRGNPKFHTIKFIVTDHSLRANAKVPRNIKKAARADFSNLTPEHVPLVYAEVKMPSEHHLFGRQYAGEFHMAHFWDRGRGRFVIIAVMMDNTNDMHHPHLEEFIREWEEVAWRRKHDCKRRLDPSMPPYQRFYSKRSREFMKDLWGSSKSSKADWDIYEGFLTTVWYCGYEGSLTVPPCSERVIWRVLDLPMQISKSQSHRMRELLSQNLNQDCQMSTKAFNGGVNRPLQDKKNDHRVWCCDSGDWKPARKSQWEGKFPKWYHGYKYSN